MTEEELCEISGIGEVIAKSFVEYFRNPVHVEQFKRLLLEVRLPEVKEDENAGSLQDMSFVITGSVHHFANRSELKEFIESKGGKVTGSVTGKTKYLINNDTESSSSKNKKAKELGIPILSEEMFLEMVKEK